MNNKILLTLALAAALAAGYLAGSRLGQERSESGAGALTVEPSEPEILYWVAPMDPNFRRDKPGKSPMGMDLVPVYADQQGNDSGDAEGGIKISPAVENNLGVRTEVATVRPMWRKIDATGYVSFDETRIGHIHLRTEGWICLLYTSPSPRDS